MEVASSKIKSHSRNIYILHEIKWWSYTQSVDFTLGNSLFGAGKLTKYFGYGIGFDARGSFLLSDCSGFGKNVIIFDGDRSSLVHIDNK